VAETKIKVTADTSQAERAIGNLEKSLDSLQSASADVAAALGIITGAAAAMTYAVLRTADAAGAVIDAADAIGISAAKLQELQYAAGLAGVGADTLNASIIRLSNNIGEGLAKGSGPAVEALKSLNIPIQEIVRSRPDEQFQRISQAILAIENPSQRVAASIELFGKQGPAILKVAEELEKVRRITEETGLGVTERDLVALDEASDSVDQLKILWDAGVKKAVAEIAPYIVAIVNKIKEAIKEAGGFEGIWKKIKEVLHTIANIATIIATILAARLVVGAAQFAFQLGRALIAAKGISAVLARTPIGLLAAGIAIAADALGVDLVGAAGDFLDLNLDIKGAEDQINVALDTRNEKLTEAVEVAQGFNEEQKKALETLETTILGLERAVQFQRDRLALGEIEARVVRVLAEENAKLEKVGLTLTQQQKDRIAGAIREEEAVKRIQATRDALRQAELKFAVPSSKEFDSAAKEIEVANKALIEAQKSGNAELIDLEQQRYDRVKHNFRQTVIQYGWSLTERGRLEMDYVKKSGDISNTQTQSLIMNNGRETDLYRALEEEKLRLKQEYAEKQLQVDVDRIQRTLMAERSGMAQKLSADDQAILQQRGAQERQAQIVNDRIAFEKKSETEKAAFVIDQGAQMFSALGAHNKKAFEAAKAFNIANAIMNTYMGATKALATYPPPFNFIAAAAVIGMGLAQVATIRNQQYSGRQLGGPVMGGTPYLVGENGPELFTPNTTGSITRNSDLGGGGPVNVNFTIVANDTTGFDELLTSRQTVIKQIISDAMLERGQRSMV